MEVKYIFFGKDSEPEKKFIEIDPIELNLEDYKLYYNDSLEFIHSELTLRNWLPCYYYYDFHNEKAIFLVPKDLDTLFEFQMMARLKYL